MKFWIAWVVLGLPLGVHAQSPDVPSAWDQKPIETWSLTEVQDFMLHSAWVVRVSSAQSGIGAASIAPRELTPDHPFYDPVTADIVAFNPRGGAVPSTPPYYVRWYSARIVREVLVRGAQLALPEGRGGLDDTQRRKLLQDDNLRYVLTVSGPGLHALDELPWSAFAKNVWLYSDRGDRFEIVDVRTPKELGGSGEVMFFFDRHDAAIAPDATRITFHAEIGTAVLEATFHPRDMVAAGRQDLAGPPASDPLDRLRQQLTGVLTRGADLQFKRALTGTEVRPVGSDHDEVDFIVVYDARRETPGQPRTASFEQRMIEAARRVGGALHEDGPHLRTFWFVDLADDRQAYLYGPDCAALAAQSGSDATELFRSAVKQPQ